MKKAAKLQIFFGINVIQGLIALYILAINPSDESHAIIYIYSIEKFLLLVAVFSLVLIFSFLFILYPKQQYCGRINKGLDWLIEKDISIWLIVFILIWTFYIIISENFYLLAQKIWPIVLWGEALTLEIMLLRSTNDRTGFDEIKIHHMSEKNGKLIGYGTLAISIIVGFMLRYYGGFADEGDNIANGWLISNDYILYKDIFSHHAPLVSYWVSWVISLFGKDVGIVRFSVVILQGLVIFCSMRVTKYYIQLGLATLAWVIISPFYFGNLVLYQALSGIFFLGCVAIFLSINLSGPSREKYLALGLLSGLTLSSDPQMIWPLFFIYVEVLILAVKTSIKERDLKNIKKVIVAFVPIFIIGSLWTLYFGIHGALGDLIFDLVIFNAEVYSKYSSSQVFRLPSIFRQGINFLYILDPQWSTAIDLRSISKNINPDYWFFTGFFFRLTALILVLYYLLAKKIALGVSIYLMVCSLFPRSVGWFHTIPFVKTAIFFCFILLLIPRESQNEASDIQTNETQNGYSGLKIILLIMMITLISKASLGIIKDRENLSYEKNWNKYDSAVQLLSEYTCGVTGWRFLDYPLNPIMYFILDKEPVTKYTFMTPWVAEIGQDEVISSLSSSENNVVHVWKEGDIWGNPVKDYMSNLLLFLQNNYFEVASGYWVSPDIYNECDHEKQ